MNAIEDIHGNPIKPGTPWYKFREAFRRGLLTEQQRPTAYEKRRDTLASRPESQDREERNSGIRKAKRAGASIEDIANRYNLAQGTIYQILNGRRG